MGKLLVDVDREALERVRVKLGARSGAEALRNLIASADVADEPGYIFRLTEGIKVIAAAQEQGRLSRAARGDALDTSRAKVTNPGKPKAPYGSRLKKR